MVADSREANGQPLALTDSCDDMPGNSGFSCHGLMAGLAPGATRRLADGCHVTGDLGICLALRFRGLGRCDVCHLLLA